jgi:hypothetical protein
LRIGSPSKTSPRKKRRSKSKEKTPGGVVALHSERISTLSVLTTAAHDQPPGLLEHAEQIFNLYVLDEPRVLPVNEDARAQVIMVSDHDPGGDANLPNLRSIVVAHDQVRAERRRLFVKGLRVSEAHFVVVWAFCSKDVRDRLLIHLGRYG